MSRLSFAHYSNIADASTITTPTNDIPVMVYEQLVPPFCYFLCICLHFYLTTIETDCFIQLTDILKNQSM